MTAHEREVVGSTPARSTPLLIGAGVFVIAVVAAVLMFGLQRPPAVVGLTDASGPAPSSAVAWLNDETGETCLRIAWPDGTTTRPWCDPNGGEVVGWDGTALLVRQWAPAQTLEIDAATGEVIAVRADETPPPATHPQPAVVSYRDGDEQVFALDDREVWRVEAPHTYGIRTSAVSAEGDWIAMVDDAERLLVLPADGGAPPRQWASDVTSWGGLVWQDR